MNTLPSDIVTFIETHKAILVTLGAWFIRELTTFGGLKGMWQFLLTGQMPAKELVTVAQIPAAPLPVTPPSATVIPSVNQNTKTP